ncbi:uncharacterized protein LOC117784597 [Drosophila innubila]|uniref:uncharacterized protein LOC117784597 n=1 Tax=Drosophila innubila TaxID=198719 RepID=UPI00148CD926|nr:uncharacterized protein LOC117784597 [Drosophila innubila]
MQPVWLLGLLLLPLPQAVASGIAAPIEYRAPKLMQVALQVLEKYVNPRYNALAIMELSRSRVMQRYHHEAITYLLHQLRERRMAFQLLMDTPIEDPRDQILFLVDSPRSFRSLRFHFAKSLFDREFNFLILLSWPENGAHETDKLNALRDIFATCLSFHVLNAVVLLEEPNGVVLLYGYRLYAPGCQDRLTPELLDRYENGEFRLQQQHQLFPRPMGSFYGCPINVSWYPLPPFVMFNGNYHDPAQRSQTYRLTGVDGELLKKLAQIFDFRINLLPPCQKELRENSDDCFQQLSDFNSSVAIGALSASLKHRDRFSTTCAYHQSALVFVVRVEHKIGAVNQLVQPFCGTVWLSLILSCLLALLLQWAWRRRRRCQRLDVLCSALHVHTTLLGNPVEVPALPHRSEVRCLIGAWLLLALVLRVAYQGKLYDVFRLPYYPPVPESISDLLSGNYTYLASDYADYFPRDRTRLRPYSFQERFKELEAAPADSKFTTNSLLDNLAHYNQLNWHTSRLTHVREHIYLYQLVMYLRRHSILKFAFDRKLKQLQSAGIVGYINRNFVESLFHAPYTRLSHEVVPIRLELFCGLYFVCQMMMLVALFIFFLELLSLRLYWLRRYFV